MFSIFCSISLSRKFTHPPIYSNARSTRRTSGGRVPLPGGDDETITYPELTHFGATVAKRQQSTVTPLYHITAYYTAGTTINKRHNVPYQPVSIVYDTAYDARKDESYLINTQYTVVKPVVTSSKSQNTYATASDSKLLQELTALTNLETAQSLVRKIKFTKKVNTNYHNMTGDIASDGETRIYTHRNSILQLSKDSDGKIILKQSVVTATSDVINAHYTSDPYKATDLPADIVTTIYIILSDNAAEKVNEGIEFVKS